jgi:hypothetical protein
VIPIEIRTEIYKILFADATLAVWERREESVIFRKAGHECLLICRAIRCEALPYFCSAMTLLVRYDSGFVVPDWTAFCGADTACPEPADWRRMHIRDWTGFPLHISPYLSGIERAIVHSDESSFPSFILNLHKLTELKYLEIRLSKLSFDEPIKNFFDIVLRPNGVKGVMVESAADPFGYLDRLKTFFFNSSLRFKARVIFPVKVNGLYTTVCCESFLI